MLLVIVPFLGFPTLIKQLFLVVLGIILMVLVNFFKKDFFSSPAANEDISGSSFKDSYKQKDTEQVIIQTEHEY
jgi:hypothetical protein